MDIQWVKYGFCLQDREQQANRELHGNDPLTSVVYEKFPEEHVKFEQLYKTQVHLVCTASTAMSSTSKTIFNIS